LVTTPTKAGDLQQIVSRKSQIVNFFTAL